MKSNFDKYVEEVIRGFQKARGRASVYCFPPASNADLVYNIIIQFYAKHHGQQILIVVDGYPTRKAILDHLASKGCSTDTYNIKILSVDYIKTQYKYTNKLIITVGVNSDISVIQHLYNSCSFMLSIFTENIMDNTFILNIRDILPSIETTVSTSSIRNDNIYSPVEEYRVGVVLSESDQEEYDKCSEYISTSVAIFGDLKNIEKCKYGDPKLNISGAEFRNSIAKENGWSEDLNTTIEYHKQIDDVYNPNTLHERANTFYNITRQRKDLLTDNEAKLYEIASICAEHKDKNILIVSKRGDFALTVTKYLNELSPGICGDYHDGIKSQIAYDTTGYPIVYKSGVNKGKPKQLGAQAVSTLNMKRFNNSEFNIMSIKSSSNNKLEIAIDVVIFTSPYCEGIIDLKTRFNKVVFVGNPLITYKIYCIGTTENTKISNEKETPIIKVIDETDNFIGYDENSGNVIL